MNSIGSHIALLASVCIVAAPLAAQQEFPLDRSILPPTPVSELGAVPLEAGGTRPFGFPTAFATSDMGSYSNAVETAFPYSSPRHPPADSLNTAQKDRLNAWIARVAPAAKGVAPEMLTAALELQANQDSPAEQIYAKLLAASTTTPMDRLFVLRDAVDDLTDGGDTTVLRRRLSLARHYLGLIEAFPRKGYATLHDSLAVLSALTSAENDIGNAVRNFWNADSVMVEAHHRFHVAAELPWSARVDLWRAGSYRLFAGKPQGQARMDSIQATARQLVTMTVAERAMGDNPAQRANQERDQLDRVANMWNVTFVHPAPGIPAHAWLNTSDSLYQPTPRTRGIATGQIHVVVLGDAENPAVGYFLQHMQARLPDAAFQVLTMTDGAEGNVLVEPADEVLWRQNILEQLMHVAVPVAMWAGPKQAARYGGMLPAPFPLWQGENREYRSNVAVTDRHGNVRAYYNRGLNWPCDDAVAAIVKYLQDEASGKADPDKAPMEILPALPTTGDPSTTGGVKPAPTGAH